LAVGGDPGIAVFYAGLIAASFAKEKRRHTKGLGLLHVGGCRDSAPPLSLPFKRQAGGMMRVLLTGSSGWLGRFLAPRLRVAGHVVIGLDVAPGADTNVIGSVTDIAVVERTFADHGVEAVVHACALHKPDIVRVHPRAFVDVNVTGTLNLLEIAVAAGHDRFVFTSTTSLMISQTIRENAGAAAVLTRAQVRSHRATFTA
jgi:hypothetical protein